LKNGKRRAGVSTLYQAAVSTYGIAHYLLFEKGGDIK